VGRHTVTKGAEAGGREEDPMDLFPLNGGKKGGTQKRGAALLFKEGVQFPNSQKAGVGDDY